MISVTTTYHRLQRIACLVFVCVLGALAASNIAVVQAADVAIFDRDGNLKRIERSVDPNEWREIRNRGIPKAADGQPRAVRVKTQPAYDAAAEKLVLERDGTWTVVPLPQEERDARAAAIAAREAEQSERQQMRAMIKQLRQDAKTDPSDSAEVYRRIRKLERAVAYLLKQQLGELPETPPEPAP